MTERSIVGIMRDVPRRSLRSLVRAYQLTVSPLIGPRCRFAPSCSEYALEAIDVHGALRGAWLALRRVLRCNPWGGSGYDPVPRGRGPADSPTHRCEGEPS